MKLFRGWDVLNLLIQGNMGCRKFSRIKRWSRNGIMGDMNGFSVKKEF